MDEEAATTGSRGRVFVAGLAGVVLLLVGALAAAAIVVRPWADSSEAVRRPPHLLEPAPEAVLATAATGAAEALTAEQVRAAIHELVSASELGDRVSASVVDLATGTELYGREATTAAVPASTIKLVTAATVLAARGPAYQIPTTAVAGAAPGEVVLVGGGDPTLALDGSGFYPDAARLDLLATQVLSALGDTPVSRVTVDSGLFTGDVHGPWTSDIPDSGYVGPITALMADGARADPDPAQGMQAAQRWEQPDLALGRQFAALLGVGEDGVARGPAPVGAAVLGEVRSPPVQRLVEIMLDTSDNVIAEVLARQVALARGEPASFEGAAAAMTAVLTEELGVGLEDGGVIADGSGLSRDNRISARLLTDLLAAAAGPHRPELGGIYTGLAVAGWSGTLADRHETPPPEIQPGMGVVRAKTGSLNGVDALAGVVVTAGGRVLGFAILSDQVGEDHTTARAALDRIPAALASL